MLIFFQCLIGLIVIIGGSMISVVIIDWFEDHGGEIYNIIMMIIAIAALLYGSYAVGELILN